MFGFSSGIIIFLCLLVIYSHNNVVYATNNAKISRMRELLEEIGGSHLHFSASHVSQNLIEIKFVSALINFNIFQIPPLLFVTKGSNGTISYTGPVAEISDFLASLVNITYYRFYKYILSRVIN